MRRKKFLVTIVGLSLILAGQFATDAIACGQVPLQLQSSLAVSPNDDVAQSAIAELREVGPAGLAALVEAHKDAIEKHSGDSAAVKVLPTDAAEAEQATTELAEWKRLKAALDAVGGQYDCPASRLFWYTDFEAAKAAAQQSGKPILSLRLLGKLTDEFSCANSRFFRSTLYANAEVSRVLRERFVLHWQSVRPVPKVTIDFGDGRKLERTLTGNSIHYILDSEGRVIDALPGLYGPQAFLHGLERAEEAVAGVKSLTDEQRVNYLQAYHADQAKLILAAWQSDLEKLGVLAQAQPAQGPAGAKPARAVLANNVARPKADVERPLVAAALSDASTLTNKTDDSVWAQVAQLHQSDAELDAASIALIKAQNPTAGQAMPLAVYKAVVETPLLRLVRTFQGTIAIDTVRNEYTFHRQIHEWFAAGQIAADIAVNDLNERVYAQLFLTPSNDPWLGLVPGDVYTALDDNGVESESRR